MLARSRCTLAAGVAPAPSSIVQEDMLAGNLLASMLALLPQHPCCGLAASRCTLAAGEKESPSSIVQGNLLGGDLLASLLALRPQPPCCGRKRARIRARVQTAASMPRKSSFGGGTPPLSPDNDPSHRRLFFFPSDEASFESSEGKKNVLEE